MFSLLKSVFKTIFEAFILKIPFSEQYWLKENGFWINSLLYIISNYVFSWSFYHCSLAEVEVCTKAFLVGGEKCNDNHSTYDESEKVENFVQTRKYDCFTIEQYKGLEHLKSSQPDGKTCQKSLLCHEFSISTSNMAQDGEQVTSWGQMLADFYMQPKDARTRAETLRTRTIQSYTLLKLTCLFVCIVNRGLRTWYLML